MIHTILALKTGLASLVISGQIEKQRYNCFIKNTPRRNTIKGSFLTARWSNILSIVLGLVAAIYVIVVLTSTVLGDAASFIGLIVIGGIT